MGNRFIRNIVGARCRSVRLLAPAIAQAQTEVSFYYPVAVGGPITKIIDGYRGRLRKGKSRDQAQADLFGQLPWSRSPRR